MVIKFSFSGQKAIVRSFVGREDTVPGSKVEFLCGETNSGYLLIPHVAPPHKCGDMHVSIAIIQVSLSTQFDFHPPQKITKYKPRVTVNYLVPIALLPLHRRGIPQNFRLSKIRSKIRYIR